MATKRAAKPSRTIRHIGRNVCVVAHNVPSSVDFEAWYLLTSDHHWDNPKCDRRLLKEHLDEAVERDAGILVAGDLYCAMQGKYDRRASKVDLRPEHQTERYLDSLVETSAEWYGKYAKNLLVVGQGNHETAITKNHETDLIQRLVALLNANHGGNVQAGGYGGWMRFNFQVRNSRNSVNLKYFHGCGGGGPVTKGVIGTNRRAVFLPDADIVATGHVHEGWLVPLMRERLKGSGTIHIDEQTHVCLATYKEEYHDGASGYHVENGRPPKPLGAWWLRFYWSGKRGRVEYELRQAK